MKPAAVILSAIAFVLMVSFAFGQIPLNFTYQARLADENGDPVPDDVYSMEFRFFSQPQGGSPVWTEPIDLETHNGFFTATIGATEPIDLGDLDGPLYLEVMVDDEVMIPRAPLTSVPFSGVSQRMLGDIITN